MGIFVDIKIKWWKWIANFHSNDSHQCPILAADLFWDRKWIAYLYPSLTSCPCLDGFFIFCPIIKNNKVSCQYGTMMWIITVLISYLCKLMSSSSLKGITSITCLTSFLCSNCPILWNFLSQAKCPEKRALKWKLDFQFGFQLHPMSCMTRTSSLTLMMK